MTSYIASLPMTRRTMLLGSGALLATSALPFRSEAAPAPTSVVDIATGNIQGETVDGVNRFLGIPYAQSIAGKNRFLPPQPVEPWAVIDGTVITDHVFDRKTAALNPDVPLMIGQNGTEFTLFMLGDQAAYDLDDEQFTARVTQLVGPDAAPRVLEIYRRDQPDHDPSGIWFRIFSDYAMGALSSEIMEVKTATSSAPVYAFRFDWLTPINGGKLYSPHTMEIPFVFDNVATEAGISMTEGGPEAEALGKIISSAWVEFARTGKPAAAGLLEWPAFTVEGREAMHLNNTSTVAPYMDSEMVDPFRNMLWKQAGLI